jgi:hypothetical protein
MHINCLEAFLLCLSVNIVNYTNEVFMTLLKLLHYFGSTWAVGFISRILTKHQFCLCFESICK